MATIALVAAFAGPAVASDAVDFAKTKLLNGKNIKKRSIAGSKLKNNTLTGIQIRESSLGKVKSATSADTRDHATNATNATTAVYATTVDARWEAPTSRSRDRRAPAENLLELTD